jgi:hypothetical protein
MDGCIGKRERPQAKAITSEGKARGSSIMSDSQEPARYRYHVPLLRIWAQSGHMDPTLCLYLREAAALTEHPDLTIWGCFGMDVLSQLLAVYCPEGNYPLQWRPEHWVGVTAEAKGTWNLTDPRVPGSVVAIGTCGCTAEPLSEFHPLMRYFSELRLRGWAEAMLQGGLHLLPFTHSFESLPEFLTAVFQGSSFKRAWAHLPPVMLRNVPRLQQRYPHVTNPQVPADYTTIPFRDYPFRTPSPLDHMLRLYQQMGLGPWDPYMEEVQAVNMEKDAEQKRAKGLVKHAGLPKGSTRGQGMGFFVHDATQPSPPPSTPCATCATSSCCCARDRGPSATTGLGGRITFTPWISSGSWTSWTTTSSTSTAGATLWPRWRPFTP